LANDIAANLAYRPDAVEAVAAHIERFWDPRMLAALRSWTDGGGEGLSELALAASHLVGENTR